MIIITEAHSCDANKKKKEIVMKKLLAEAPYKTKVVEVPEPQITGKTQIKIRLTYCGVCMSEHYAWSVCGKAAFGHEPVGVVTEVGAGVKKVKRKKTKPIRMRMVKDVRG